MTDDGAVGSRLIAEFAEIRRRGEWENDTPGNVMAIVGEVVQWVKTGNPFYMDHALEIAEQLGAPRTPTFSEQLIKAMHARREGKQKGTWKQVRRHSFQDRAFLMICLMRSQGETLERASEQASIWLSRYSGGEFSLTAESLEKVYQEKFVKPGWEAEYQRAWREDGDAWESAVDGLRAVQAEYQARRGTRR